jgi:hypothetical protein
MKHPFPVPSLTERARRITRALPGAVACRQTAAQVGGLSVLTAGLPEEDWPVELIASSHLAVPGCVTYLSPLPRDDITDHDGVRLTTRDRTAGKGCGYQGMGPLMSK